MASQQQNVVTAQLHAERRSVDTHIENIPSLLGSLAEAAQNMQTYAYRTGVEGAKTAFQAMLSAEAALATHARAVQDMELGYQAPESTADETDFSDLMQSATERHRNPNFNAAETSQYKEFVEGLDEEADQESGPAMIDEDGDLQIERGNNLAPNRICPLSMVEIMLLEDPVEDSKGFVYQKSSILDYIRNRPGGVVPAPSMGATHQVRVADLRPAKKVLKAQKRQRKAQLTQTQPPSADDVLDAD